MALRIYINLFRPKILKYIEPNTKFKYRPFKSITLFPILQDQDRIQSYQLVQQIES